MTSPYKIRWAQPGQPAVGSVDIEARDDESARRKADKLAVELNLTNTPRTITRHSRHASSFVVIETLNRGKR